jgi:hypothetical protein
MIRRITLPLTALIVISCLYATGSAGTAAVTRLSRSEVSPSNVSTPNFHLAAPIVGMASTPDGKGYWLVASDGGVFAFGDATFWGSAAGTLLNRPVVGMAPTPDGGGYWLATADGGVFAYGDAQFYGSMAGQSLNAPVVGIVPISAFGGTIQGYWLVAADGGVFSFGTAPFVGSQDVATGSYSPMVAVSAAQTFTSPRTGYRYIQFVMTSADGSVGAYIWTTDPLWAGAPSGFPPGPAPSGFPPGAAPSGLNGVAYLAAPVDGIAVIPGRYQSGYVLTAGDGGVFMVGTSTPFLGSANTLDLNAPTVGIALTPDGAGYWLVGSDGGMFAFGDASFYGSLPD